MSADKAGTVVNAIVTALPSILSLIARSPDETPDTEAAARAHLEDVVRASLARDEQLRAAAGATDATGPISTGVTGGD